MCNLEEFVHLCFFPQGDAGIICVPDSVGVLLLLFAGCCRFLCPAHRDHRTGPPGVQSQRVGSGDDGTGPRPQSGRDSTFQL